MTQPTIYTRGGKPRRPFCRRCGRTCRARRWRADIGMGCGPRCCTDRVLFFCSARCLHEAINALEMGR